MSLELVIKENTEVLRQLIAVMRNGGNVVAPDAPPQADSVKKEQRKGPFYWKIRGEQRMGVTPDIDTLESLVKSGKAIEPNRAEYLRFTEASEKAEKKGPDTPPEAVVEKAPEPEAAEPVPDTAALYAQARDRIKQLVTAGYRDKAVEILGKSGAQKLGQVPAENLADVVMLAEQALRDMGIDTDT